MGQDVSSQPFPFSSMKGVVIAVKTHAHKHSPKAGAGSIHAPTVHVMGPQSDGESAESGKGEEKQSIPSDGHRWRKYGRKMIAGQARHYYRCTAIGCEAKRHVTWDSNKQPIIVPVGEHDHSAVEVAEKASVKRQPTENDIEETKKRHCPDASIPCVSDLTEFILAEAKEHELVAYVETPDLAEDGFVWAKLDEKSKGKIIEYACTYNGCPGRVYLSVCCC
jgi:hypothetical protein